jgi:hypothetical protein
MDLSRSVVGYYEYRKGNSFSANSRKCHDELSNY